MAKNLHRENYLLNLSLLEELKTIKFRVFYSFLTKNNRGCRNKYMTFAV